MIDNRMINVWKSINISTMLFLKLFEVEFKENEKSHTIHSHCFSGGLISAFLDKSHSYLHLLFDRETALSFNNPDFKNDDHYSNIIDRLIDHKHYNSIKNYGPKVGLIRVSLKIPNIYLPDLEKIVEFSKFSAVSNAFKKKMKLPAVVKYTSNPKVRLILSEGLPYKIAMGSEKLRKKLKEEFKSEHVGELYSKFQPEKEYWDEEKMLLIYGRDIEI